MSQASGPRSSIRVLIADSTLMACELLASVLNRTTSMHVVGWEVDWEAALALVARVHPDVALISLDLQDGPGKGLALVSKMHLKHPEIRSVILLDRPDHQGVVDAFRAGARGIVSRGASLSALPKCVQRVNEGQVWADSTELSFLLDTFAQTAPARTLTDNCCRLLTEREQAVVHLVADGLSNREVAARLNLSQHTVKNYLFRVFDKIGVSSRVELVLCALADTTNSSPAAKLESDRLHPVSVAVRRRPDRITNA